MLVAEDDAALLQLASAILQQEGYAVLQAPDGAAAIEAARSAEQLDILFTDIVMPGPDGFEVGTALASARPGLRAVFTTALMNDQARARASALGCELLSKPYTPADLRRAIAEASPLRPGDGDGPR